MSYFGGSNLESMSSFSLSKGNLKTAFKEYKSRTTSNALRSVGSQIGRNIKSLVC